MLYVPFVNPAHVFYAVNRSWPLQNLQGHRTLFLHISIIFVIYFMSRCLTWRLYQIHAHFLNLISGQLRCKKCVEKMSIENSPLNACPSKNNIPHFLNLRRRTLKVKHAVLFVHTSHKFAWHKCIFEYIKCLSAVNPYRPLHIAEYSAHVCLFYTSTGWQR